MACGIGSMVVGLLALASGVVPCVGYVVAWPVGGIGFMLGVGALVVSIVKKGRLVGLPIAGMALNLAGLLVATLWYTWALGVAREITAPPVQTPVSTLEPAKTPPPTPQAKRNDEGRRVLTRTETLLAMKDRRLGKGDRITLSPTMSFHVSQEFSDEKGICVHPSWDRKLFFATVREYVKDPVVAGLVRLGGKWEIIDASVENGMTLYGIIPFPPPE